ncbi:MAG TPA: hypothetical protein VHT97_06370 [Acidimicrobiales bacterium]|jgi:hypothetical protein|nr:hypothetical protein [Acidimicrobiales bacterium]
MAELLILEFEGVGEAEYWAVNRELGIDMVQKTGDIPDGLLVHSGGTADSGKFVVTEVWSSREAQGAFMQSRLGAALAAGGVTSAPTVTWVSLVAFQTFGG